MNTEYRYGKTRKNIAKTIKEKIVDWAESIVDEDVKKIVLNDHIVTGGCIASMLLGEKVNDFDVYFNSRKSAMLVADYYIKQWNYKNDDGITLDTSCEDRLKIFIKSSGIAEKESGKLAKEVENPVQEVEENEETGCDEIAGAEDILGYEPVFLSGNAITLSDRIQIIIRFYGDAKEIHKNFDFVHATCYFSNGELVLPGQALESILARTLVYSGSLYPIASIFRMKKFMNRGWKISAGTMLKIMWQISELDMRLIDVLQEQLTGVDQTHMRILIEALRDKEPGTINSTYVAEVIDRIFGA